MMLETCVSVIQDRNIPLLREILLRFPIVLEIRRIFDEEDFMSIVTAVTYTIATKCEGASLDSHSLYLFVSSGKIVRRREQRTEKSIRLKSRGKTKIGREGGMKQGHNCEIGEFGHFEQAANDHVYVPHAPNAIVLSVDFHKLPDNISTRVRELRNERFRFIHGFSMLTGVEKWALEDQLYKFRFLQLKFGATRQLATLGEIFFVKSGSIEVGSKGTQGRAIEGACVVGLDSCDIQIKATSQTVLGYTIKYSFLQGMMKTKMTRNIKENVTIDRVVASAMVSPTGSQTGYLQKENRLSESGEILRSSSSFRKRVCMKTTLECSPSLQKERKQQLRKHFSNFYNEVFEEFSQKKARQLALTGANEEKLVLYQIRVLERKQPKMEELHQRLRGLRLQKIKRCQQAMAQRKHIRELRNVGVTVE